MRIWSIHPSLLDTSGLTGAWAEGILAKNILLGKKAYPKSQANHPQLDRFRAMDNPVESIDAYLWGLYAYASLKGYRFDQNKLGDWVSVKIPVMAGQIEYEHEHLKKKLKQRSPEKYGQAIKKIKLNPHRTNPVFYMVPGGIEKWEKTK